MCQEASAQDVYLGMYQESNIFLGIGLLENREGILASKPKVVCWILGEYMVNTYWQRSKNFAILYVVVMSMDLWLK